MAESLRLLLRRVVLESGTTAGRIYNLVIFGTILLSVVGLLVQPHPMRVAAPGEIPLWVGELERACLLVFMADYLLHLWVSPKPLTYARSFFGMNDLSAVLAANCRSAALPCSAKLRCCWASWLMDCRALRQL